MMRYMIAEASKHLVVPVLLVSACSQSRLPFRRGLFARPRTSDSQACEADMSGSPVATAAESILCERGLG